MSLYPVFVVGSPRSGTSILIGALLRAGYGGFYEGNFLSLARVIERDVDRSRDSFYTPNPKVLTSRIDYAALKDELIRTIVAAASKEQPAGPWVDKTGGPEMIEAIPILRRLFPGARFVFAKRRAIENVVSRIVKFPHMSFDYHCSDWARTMAAWRVMRDAGDANDLLEIDQRDISTAPDEVAARLASFLQLDPRQTEQMVQMFTTQRPQQTESGSADRVLSLAQLSWTDAQKASIEKLCGAEMQAEGYSYDR
jgi:hypothetical protein